MSAVAIFRHGTGGRRQDDESWGQAFIFSLIVHGGILAILLMTGGQKPPGAGPVLTEVNFIEKPAPPPEASAPIAPESVKGIPDLTAQSPSAVPASQTVSFSAPSGPAHAEPVAAPIIAAPIAPIGELGGIGMKKAALAPMPSARDMAPAKRGPLLMPGAGGGDRSHGRPIALATQGVDDVRRQGGGLGIPLTTEGGLTGGGAGRAGAPIGEALSAPRKVAIEKLTAEPVQKDSWGKKGGAFSLEGPLKYRKILKKEIPPYPRWAEEKGIEASVSYRIWADSKGRVIPEKVYLEKTSGYSELDAAAKESLLKLVFVAQPDGQTSEDEWGVATIRFELKK